MISSHIYQEELTYYINPRKEGISDIIRSLPAALPCSRTYGSAIQVRLSMGPIAS